MNKHDEKCMVYPNCISIWFVVSSAGIEGRMQQKMMALVIFTPLRHGTSLRFQNVFATLAEIARLVKCVTLCATFGQRFISSIHV